MISIDRARIATLIPHAGSMCLLDRVTHWNETGIRCLSWRFRWQDNPLRRPDGSLGAASGIEMAAQAMAIHGQLTSGRDGKPVQGYLASVRDVRLERRWIDAVSGDLMIVAERLMGDAAGASYGFTVSADDVLLLGGRATVLFAAAS